MAQSYFGPDYSMVRKKAAQAGTDGEQRSILPIPVGMDSQQQQGGMFNPAPSYARPRGMGQFLGGGAAESPATNGPGIGGVADPLGGDSGPGDPGTPSGMGPAGGGSIFSGINSPSGRGVLSAISMAGLAFPNPISTMAGIANGAMSWGNMNQLDATRGAYDFPELNAGQRAGGMLGFNGYGRSSVANDFNNQMGRAIAGGQPVTVPQVFGDPNAGAGASLPGSDANFGGVNFGDLSSMGYSGGFGVF